MSDIAFQCQSCSKNLAVGDTFIGVEFPCPDCQTQLTVPSPHRVFHCPSCGSRLYGDLAICGQIFGCPDCEHMFEVPQVNTIRCSQCGVHLEIEDEYYDGVAGADVDCPQCNAAVEVPVIPVLLVEAPPDPPHPELVHVPCPGCKTDICLQPDAYQRDAGKLIRCPKCKHFLRVPPNLEIPAIQEPEAKPAATPAAGKGSGDFKATMRMDSLLESIPQGRRIQEGHCLYCDLPTKRIDAHTFVCENCRRVFRTMKHHHGNTPRR